MSKKTAYLLIGILLLALGLTACNRPLPEPTSQPKAQQPTTEPDDALGSIILSATQTAQQALVQPPVLETAAPVVVEQPTTGPVVVEPLPTQAPLLATPVLPVLTVPTSYTLKKGEFVYCIARRFNVNPSELLALNGLTMSSAQVVSAGRLLNIPQTGNPFPGARALRAHPTTYTVMGSETIYSIACLFGDVDPMAIAAANGLAEPYNLTAGQVLNIP